MAAASRRDFGQVAQFLLNLAEFALEHASARPVLAHGLTEQAPCNAYARLKHLRR